MQFVMSGGMKLPAGLNPQQEQAMKIQMQYQIQHFHNQGMTPQQIAQVSIDHCMFFHHWPGAHFVLARFTMGDGAIRARVASAGPP